MLGPCFFILIFLPTDSPCGRLSINIYKEWVTGSKNATSCPGRNCLSSFVLIDVLMRNSAIPEGIGSLGDSLKTSLLSLRDFTLISFDAAVQPRRIIPHNTNAEYLAKVLILMFLSIGRELLFRERIMPLFRISFSPALQRSFISPPPFASFQTSHKSKG